jgi:hypothetical protein
VDRHDAGDADGMRGTTWERWGAVSGLVALAVAGVAVGFERSAPNPDRSPAEVVVFYTEHRGALLAQSLLFVLSSGILLWFLAALRSYLARAEGHTDRLPSVAYAAGIAWLLLNLAVQAPQIALARAANGALRPEVAVVVNDVGLALATIADVPLAVLAITVAVLCLRSNAFPAWLGWFSVVNAVVHLVAAFGIVADTGPLAPGGWVTFSVYPVFVVWLLAVISAMITRTRHPIVH